MHPEEHKDFPTMNARTTPKVLPNMSSTRTQALETTKRKQAEPDVKEDAYIRSCVIPVIFIVSVNLIVYIIMCMCASAFVYDRVYVLLGANFLCHLIGVYFFL